MDIYLEPLGLADDRLQAGGALRARNLDPVVGAVGEPLRGGGQRAQVAIRQADSAEERPRPRHVGREPVLARARARARDVAAMACLVTRTLMARAAGSRAVATARSKSARPKRWVARCRAASMPAAKSISPPTASAWRTSSVPWR